MDKQFPYATVITKLNGCKCSFGIYYSLNCIKYGTGFIIELKKEINGKMPIFDITPCFKFSDLTMENIERFGGVRIPQLTKQSCNQNS